MLTFVVVVLVALMLALGLVAAVEWADQFNIVPARAPRLRGGPALGAFLVRRGRVAIYVARSWWADQVGSWRELLSKAPTFAESFPVLAYLWTGARWLVSTPERAVIALVFALQFIGASPAYALVVAGPVRHLRSYAPVTQLQVDPATQMGKRLFLQMKNGRANRYVQIYIAYNITIAVANGVAVRNLGLPEAIIEEVGINGGGEGDTVVMDGRAAAFQSDWQLSTSPTTRQRLTSPNIAASVPMRAQFRIWYENPRSVKPRETVFLEKVVNNDLNLFVKFATVKPGAAAASHQGTGMLVEGAATTEVTFDAGSLIVRAEQLAATGQVDLPLFRPQVSQVFQNVPGINARFEVKIPIADNEYLRGLTVIFVTNVDMVEPLSTGSEGIGLRSDNLEYLGEGALVQGGSYLRGSSNFESGAEVFALFGGRAFQYDFQQEGRLTNCYNPTQDKNLRLILNMATVPANLSVLVVKHSLIRDLWVDPTSGRRVVAPTLPPELADAA